MALSAQIYRRTNTCRPRVADDQTMKNSRLELVLQSARARELMIVIGVIMVAGSAQVVFYADAVYKAALTEPLYLMQPLKEEVIDRLARTGSWDDEFAGEAVASVAGGRGARGKRIASARDLEETHADLTRTEAQAADIEGLGERRQSSSNAIVGLSNGIPMAVVASSYVQTPSIIELRPVVNPTLPAMVNWLCGRQQEFAGMSSVPPREPVVPVDLLPLPCRARL